VLTDPASAELTKYAANAFLAMRVSFVNSIANLADAVGADIADVVEGIGSDPRIGKGFLAPGPGYGGSCFPKDLPALVAVAAEHGLDLELIRAVAEVNRRQPERIVAKAAEALGGLRDKRITLLGLAFKAGTDDTSSSPALRIAELLLEGGARVRAYDPEASSDLDGLEQAATAADAVAGADAVVVATEWPEFAELDLGVLAASMAGSVVVDARNLLDRAAARSVGLDYRGVGR
jgi:UDPglucose 6-dehydrogenase